MRRWYRTGLAILLLGDCGLTKLWRDLRCEIMKWMDLDKAACEEFCWCENIVREDGYWTYDDKPWVCRWWIPAQNALYILTNSKSWRSCELPRSFTKFFALIISMPVKFWEK